MSETVIISGEEFTSTDSEARRIMDALAEHPSMPLREDRPLPPIRILVNLILCEHARGQQ